MKPAPPVIKILRGRYCSPLVCTDPFVELSPPGCPFAEKPLLDVLFTIGIESVQQKRCVEKAQTARWSGDSIDFWCSSSQIAL